MSMPINAKPFRANKSAYEAPSIVVPEETKPTKSRKKTAAMAKAEERNTKLQRYALQESKRAPKIQVDQKIVLLTWLVAVGIAFISSAVVYDQSSTRRRDESRAVLMHDRLASIYKRDDRMMAYDKFYTGST
jgi:hypothetical protein